MNRGQSTTYFELRNVCEACSSWQQDIHQPFGASFDIRPDGSQLVFFLSTRNWLRIPLKRGDLLHADGTYKVNWHEWPVCIPSVTDHDGHIHPLGIAVMSSEAKESYKKGLEATKVSVEKECRAEWSPKHLVEDGTSRWH